MCVFACVCLYVCVVYVYVGQSGGSPLKPRGHHSLHYLSVLVAVCRRWGTFYYLFTLYLISSLGLCFNQHLLLVKQDGTNFGAGPLGCVGVLLQEILRCPVSGEYVV